MKVEVEFSTLRARARTYEQLMLRAAVRHKVDPRTLWAIAYMETRFRTGLVSGKGARGLMQFMPATAARFNLRDPDDAGAAIDAAARYVRYLAGKFANNPALVLAAYNAGEGTVESYRKGVPLRFPNGKVVNAHRHRTSGIPPYAETVRYVAGGLSIMKLASRLEVFTAIQLAACGVPGTVPVRLPSSDFLPDASAYPARSQPAASVATDAIAFGGEDGMEAAAAVVVVPDPTSLLARETDEHNGARPQVLPAQVASDDAFNDDETQGSPTSSYATNTQRVRPR